MFAQMQPHEPFIDGLRLTLKNKPFWILMIPSFCITLIYPTLQTGLLYYIDYVVVGQDLILFGLALIIGIVFGLGFNLKKIATWGSKKTMIICLSLISISFTIYFFFGRNSSMAAVPMFCIGFGFAGALIANGVLMGDVIDNDELITGKRREAIYGGVNAIVTKPAISIANWMFLGILTIFGFVDPIIENGIPIKQSQSELAIIGILVAFCIIPAILIGISAFTLHWYPLHGPEWLKKKKYIMELHEQKELEYLQKLSKE